MIAKVIRGTDARRLLHYLYGPGRANEHADPHLVAGFGDPSELEPARHPGGSPDLRCLAGLLAQPLAALAGPSYDKPVWHCAVRAAPGDRHLSDAEWADVAADIMHRTGLAQRGDEAGVRWVAVRHADDHIHLVATLARQDGTRPRIWNDFYRVREACRATEERLGLRVTAPADSTAARRPSRAETEQAARRGWGEPCRVTLRRQVCEATAGARTEQEFFGRLAADRVLVRKRYSTVNPGQVTGYAVGLSRHRSRDGGLIWYGGGKLAADLTLPKLRARWSVGTGEASGTGLSASTVRAVLRQAVTAAADRAANEAEFFARLHAAGIDVRKRFSEFVPGEVTGYAVTLHRHADPDGSPVWYGGGRLSAGLTLPQLRVRWGSRRQTAPKRSGPGAQWTATGEGASCFTAAEIHTMYSDAARHAAMAAEHIRRHVRDDPDRAADAAHAAADTLHIAARLTRSRTLRCAADAYDRAARMPFGRVPGRTSEGNQLRAAARILALICETGGGSLPLAATALTASLAGLVVTVAELRDAQRHAAQAAAARKAAEHLRMAHGQLRGSVVGPHQAEALRAARPGRAARWPGREFPQSPLAGLRETTQPGPPDTDVASPSPHRTSGQSPRASPRR